MNDLDSWSRKWRTLWCWTHMYVHYKRAQAHARSLPEEAQDIYWSEQHSHFAELIWQNISELRGWWVKVGQFLSTRSDLLPHEYIVYLSKLQDMMPSTPWPQIKEILEKELGIEWNTKFQEIKEIPMASASIAQVHAAKLRDGTKVIVKIQHPNVEETLQQDMTNLAQLSWAFGIVEKNINFLPMIKEWQKAASKELDFTFELKHQQRAYDLLMQSNVDITVPVTYPEYSSKRILTMEYIEGFKITDKKLLKKYEVNVYQLLYALCDSFAYQIHIGGFFHGDPHPGNILVVYNSIKQKYQPALIDWGLVKIFDFKSRRAFSKMVYCVSTLNLMGLMESFEEMGFKFKDNQNTIDPEMYMDALRIAFRDNDSKPSEHRAIKESSYAAYKAASEIPSLNRKEIEDSNPLEDWPKDIIFFIRIASLIHGICIELNQSIPFLKILANRAQQFLCSEGSSRVLLNNKIIRECNYSEIQNYSYDKDMVRSKTLGNRKSSYGKSKFGRRLDDFVESLIESKSLLGCQIVVISKGKVIGNTFKGKMGSIDGRQVREDTLFNGFNACLGILVTGILLCVEKQLLSLDDPICHYWDGFIRYGKRNITLRHILTHRSGIHAFFPENFNLTTMFNYKKMVQIIEDTTPQYLPDESTHYNPYLLGWVLSEMISLVTNIPTPEFLQSELFLPLNLENDIFMPVPPANQVKEIEAIQHVECVNNSNRMIEYKDYREKQPEISLPVFTEEANYNSIGSNTQFGLFMKNSIDQIIELGKKHFTDKFQVRNFGIDQHEDNVKNNLNDEETNNIEQQSPSCSEKNMIEQIGTEQISAKNEAIYDRIASVSRIVEFSSISHEEVLKKFSMATYALKGKRNDSNYNDKNLPSSSKDIRKHKKTLTHAQTKKFTPFGILQIKPHVMDPLVQNSHKVMNIWIPPTCGKLTALSLAKFYHHLGCGNIISQNILKQASIPTSTDQTFESLILTGGSSRKWGFGYQIIECIYEPKKYNIHNLMWKSNLVDNSKLTHGQIICGLGHADMGGNIGCTFPDLQLSLAFLTNDYLKGSYASQCILHYVLEKFGLRIINYVPVVP